MNEKTILTPDSIKKMSYTDFVGTINQWNVPPGSYVTLSKWGTFSRINAGSRILEVACTTGFSVRELVLMYGCTGEGFDISARSIAAANDNKERYAPTARLTFSVADGYAFQSSEKFTHIVVGACLGFFPYPRKMLERCISMLDDGGYVLASPFYVTKEIPPELIARAKHVFEITPTTQPYKEILAHYKGLEIMYEDRSDLVQETDEELKHYCGSTVERVCNEQDISSAEIRIALYDRLMEIKRMSNDLRPYQACSTLVLRYRSHVYPNRFVELF